MRYFEKPFLTCIKSRKNFVSRLSGVSMNDLNGWAEAGHVLDSLNVETEF